MGRAFLTGAIKDSDSIASKGDMRATMPRFQGENLDKNLNLVKELGELAIAKGSSKGQLGLAWLLAKGEFIAPIPGTKHVKYLEENAAAVNISLSVAELSKMDELFSPSNIAGERYTYSGMVSLDRD